MMENNVNSSEEASPRVFSRPLQFFAFGFGSGLSPRAPGTAGTVVAVPLFILLSGLSLPLYSLAVVIAALLGVWFCQAASTELGVHDHSGIVWDEFVGYWITMWALPATWQWMLAGFIVFRLFDIAKPWPISVLDKNVDGGFGIMIDDIVAGVFACAVLHGAQFVWHFI